MLVAHLLGKMPSKEARIMATDTTKDQSWVQKTPGVCGGRACIRNTRITVWGVVNSRRLGAADEQIPGERRRAHACGPPRGLGLLPRASRRDR